MTRPNKPRYTKHPRADFLNDLPELPLWASVALAVGFLALCAFLFFSAAAGR